MKGQDLLTSTQFAKAIGVSVVTLKRWHENGVLKAYLVEPTGRKKYSREQIEEYYSKYKVGD